jgi:Tfp pilus assembly protein PilV
MAVKRHRYQPGLTFVELLTATVVLLIAVIGTSAFRYQSSLGARKADLRTTAARTALMLCEAWRGAAEPNAFDPETQLDALIEDGTFDIDQLAEPGDRLSVPSGFTLLGTYKITIDNVEYYAALCWKDVASGLRALNVMVAWNQRGYGPGNGFSPDKSFALTTYVDI